MGPEGLSIRIRTSERIEFVARRHSLLNRAATKRFCWRHIQFNLTGDRSRRRVLIAPSSILQAEGHLPSPNGS